MSLNRKFYVIVFLLFFTINFSSGVIAKDVKLYQVSSGVLKFDKGWLTAMKDVGKILEFPVAMYIIDHPRGLVVYDTGMNVAVSDGKCDSYWEAVYVQLSCPFSEEMKLLTNGWRSLVIKFLMSSMSFILTCT